MNRANPIFLLFFFATFIVSGLSVPCSTSTVNGVVGAVCTTNAIWQANILCRINGLGANDGVLQAAAVQAGDNPSQASTRANALNIYNLIIAQSTTIYPTIAATNTGLQQAYLATWENLLNKVGPSLLGTDWQIWTNCGLSTGLATLRPNCGDQLVRTGSNARTAPLCVGG